MKNFKIIYLLTLVFFSCKNEKPYKEVNIIRSDESKPKFVKPVLTLPQIFGKQDNMVLEIDQSNIILQSWDKDSILVEFDGDIEEFEKIDLYEGNRQIVINETQGKANSKKKALWEIKTPKFINLIIRSHNGEVTISNLDGTFQIQSPVGNVSINESTSALIISSQTGKIQLVNWTQKGRSKIQSASNMISISSAHDHYYQLNLHSGSDTLKLDLQGHKLNCNVELLTFKGEGEVFSDFPMSEISPFYSDALNKEYDLRKIEFGKNLPLASLSTGNGVLILSK